MVGDVELVDEKVERFEELEAHRLAHGSQHLAWLWMRVDEEFVEHDGHGVAEVEALVLRARGDRDEDVAELQLVVVEAVILPTEADPDDARETLEATREVADLHRVADVGFFARWDPGARSKDEVATAN